MVNTQDLIYFVVDNCKNIKGDELSYDDAVAFIDSLTNISLLCLIEKFDNYNTMGNGAIKVNFQFSTTDYDRKN